MAILDYTELSVEERAERNQPLPEQLNIVDIVDLWHTNKRDREIYYEALFKAYGDGKGLLHGRKRFNPGDFNNFIGGLDKYWNIEIIRADFLNWLKMEGEPLPVNCLLAKWCQTDPVTGTGTTRKKLIPLQRETNEGLSLLYEIFAHYGVEYLDQLSGHKAWGKIISKEFSSELISVIATSNKYITLSGGEKLYKADFGDKYRKRFV